MAIDNCAHTFSEIAQNVLPGLMEQMNSSIARSIPINRFLTKGEGIKTLLKQYQFHTDFQGCYVIIENDQLLYVGISRHVFRRLWYHSRGKTHYTATLAYRMAANEYNSSESREARMKDTIFFQSFSKAQKRIQKCNVAFIPIDNDLVLYLFEAYCAIELDTYQWNTFRTH